MRRLALVPVLALLVAGCGWPFALPSPIQVGPPRSSHGCTVVTPGGTEHPCSVLPNPVPSWIKGEHLPPAAVPGAKLFTATGCMACHTYAGSGSSNLGAPDLTAEGSRNSSIPFQIAHLKCPSCVHPGSPMPPFDQLGKKRLREVAIFLVASKGTH